MTDTSFKSAAIAEEWWRGLTSDQGGDRAAMARLRRSHTPLEVIQEPAALRLVARLDARGEHPDRVAALAGILALVREADERPLARMIGRVSLDNDSSPPPLMSEARFRRLLQVRASELMEPMRRVVRLAKGRANVYDLAFVVLRWGERVQRRLIFEYYNVSVSGGRGSAPAQSSSADAHAT